MESLDVLGSSLCQCSGSFDQGWVIWSSVPYHRLIRLWVINDYISGNELMTNFPRKSWMFDIDLVIWSAMGGGDRWSGHQGQIIGWSSYRPSLIFPQWSVVIAFRPVFRSQTPGWDWGRRVDMKMVLNGQRPLWHTAIWPSENWERVGLGVAAIYDWKSCSTGIRGSQMQATLVPIQL